MDSRAVGPNAKPTERDLLRVRTPLRTSVCVIHER